MNIICNNCVGARMYEVSGMQFPNPFMWNAINAYDFIKLVEEYDAIDLRNPEMELERYLNRERESVLVTMDNGVKLHFIHYIQDDTKDVPVKEKNTDILYRDILSYASDKWHSRLRRSSEPPMFMFTFNYMKKDNPSYKDILDKLIGTGKGLIIVMHDSVKTGEVPPNVRIIKFDDETMSLDAGLSRILSGMLFGNTGDGVSL